MLSKKVKARRQYNRDNSFTKSWQNLRNILGHRLYAQLPSGQRLLSSKHVESEEREKIFDEAKHMVRIIGLEITAINHMSTRQEVHEYHRKFHLRIAEIRSGTASIPEQFEFKASKYTASTDKKHYLIPAAPQQ